MKSIESPPSSSTPTRRSSPGTSGSSTRDPFRQKSPIIQHRSCRTRMSQPKSTLRTWPSSSSSSTSPPPLPETRGVNRITSWTSTPPPQCSSGAPPPPSTGLRTRRRSSSRENKNLLPEKEENNFRIYENNAAEKVPGKSTGAGGAASTSLETYYSKINPKTKSQTLTTPNHPKTKLQPIPTLN